MSSIQCITGFCLNGHYNSQEKSIIEKSYDRIQKVAVYALSLASQMKKEAGACVVNISYFLADLYLDVFIKCIGLEIIMFFGKDALILVPVYLIIWINKGVL